MELLKPRLPRSSWATSTCAVLWSLQHHSPGHMRYLEQAKTMGERLIVAVQGDQMLSHSGNPHHFPAKERALVLAWLHVVDYVLILDKGNLADAIKWLSPNFLVLGKEFENERHWQMIEPLKMLEKIGGSVVYHAGEIQYATELLGEEQADLNQERCKISESCKRQQVDLKQLQQAIDRFQQARLLVLGIPSSTSIPHAMHLA